MIHINKYILTYTFFLLSISIKSQNLVIDGSFEDIRICPHLTSSIIDSSNSYWKTIQTHEGSIDHFSTCVPQFPIGLSIPDNEYGFQDTCHLNSYVGGYMYRKSLLDSNSLYTYREYMTGAFSDTLKENFCYKVSFKYSLGEKISRYAIKNFGIYFSDNIPNNNTIGGNYTNLNHIPQIEVNQYLYETESWIEVNRFYSSQGGEKYITLGNFKNDLDTDTLFLNNIIDGAGIYSFYSSYLFLDDIRVEEVPFQNLGELNLGGDTILCTGEQITFNNILPDSTVYVWNHLSNDTVFTIDSSGQYILEAYNGCSYTSDTINVEFVEPIVELGDDKLVCKREEVVLQSLTPQHPKTEYTWYNQTKQLSTEQQLNITEEGIYSLQVNVDHCTDSDTIEIKYHIPTNAQLSTVQLDTAFCVSGILDATSTAWNDKYLWNTEEETQTIEVSESGEYSVYTENECAEATSTFNVKIESLEEGINNYNIFSPNGDFINDNFTIYEGNSEEYQISIYNRWGKLIWQTDDPTNHWSAEGVSDGSYFYYLSFRNCAGEIVEQKGTVEVKR